MHCNKVGTYYDIPPLSLKKLSIRSKKKGKYQGNLTFLYSRDFSQTGNANFPFRLKHKYATFFKNINLTFREYRLVMVFVHFCIGIS